MEITRVRVRRVGEGENAARWSEALAAPEWAASSRILKEDGESWVRRASLAGRDVLVKCRPARGAGERFKRLLRSTRGDRHWRGASWLMKHGFATAPPLALADALVDGIPCELLVTQYIHARSVLDHLAAHDLTVREEHAVARALAHLVVEMANKGKYNRDGKPSNLLVVRDPAGNVRIATIDTVAIRPARPSYAIPRSLANLMIEPIGINAKPRLALCARAVREIVGPPQADKLPERRLARAPHWREPMAIINAHGDPRPRVNPVRS